MKNILVLVIFFFLSNCSKPKTVLICGDHICINKVEAQQYFEKNLSIEVQVVDYKKKKEIDLVELNLRHNKDNRKEVTFSKVSQNEVRPYLKKKYKEKEELKKKKNKKIVKKYEKKKLKKGKKLKIIILKKI